MLKFSLPNFLDNITSQDRYKKWVYSKARAHYYGDKKREKLGSLKTAEDYRVNIHQAVLISQGRDYYTGEFLDWHLISTYDNTKSKEGRTQYKKTFSLLPTLDHLDPEKNDKFVICAWQTNDAKNDMSHEEFVALCKKVSKYHPE